MSQKYGTLYVSVEIRTTGKPNLRIVKTLSRITLNGFVNENLRWNFSLAPRNKALV